MTKEITLTQKEIENLLVFMENNNVADRNDLTKASTEWKGTDIGNLYEKLSNNSRLRAK